VYQQPAVRCLLHAFCNADVKNRADQGILQQTETFQQSTRADKLKQRIS
jgi:hypothetical protein